MDSVQVIRGRDCIAGVLVLCRMSTAAFIIVSRCGVCLLSPSTIMSVPDGYYRFGMYCDEELGRKTHCVGVVLKLGDGVFISTNIATVMDG